jgi:hypothetical protein
VRRRKVKRSAGEEGRTCNNSHILLNLRSQLSEQNLHPMSAVKCGPVLGTKSLGSPDTEGHDNCDHNSFVQHRCATD